MPANQARREKARSAPEIPAADLDVFDVGDDGIDRLQASKSRLPPVATAKATDKETEEWKVASEIIELNKDLYAKLADS